MANFRVHTSGVTFVFAKDERTISAFKKRHPELVIVPVVRVEDFPREEGLHVIAVGDYDKNPEHELFFGDEALFCKFKATIFYEREL